MGVSLLDAGGAVGRLLYFHVNIWPFGRRLLGRVLYRLQNNNGSPTHLLPSPLSRHLPQ